MHIHRAAKQADLSFSKETVILLMFAKAHLRWCFGNNKPPACQHVSIESLLIILYPVGLTLSL